MKLRHSLPAVLALLSIIPTQYAKPVAEKVRDLGQKFLRQLLHVVIIRSFRLKGTSGGL